MKIYSRWPYLHKMNCNFLRTDTNKIWITTDVKRKIPTTGKKRKTVIISMTEENTRLSKDVLDCSLLTDCDVTMTRYLICQENWTAGFILPSATLSQVKRTVLRCKLWALTKTIMVTIWDNVAQWLYSITLEWESCRLRTHWVFGLA